MKTKVGLIGAGYVALRHLVALRDLDFVDIVGIADTDPARAQELARRFQIAGIYRDAAEMIDATRPDAVHILTPPSSHAALA